jgi:hypothetical protein
MTLLDRGAGQAMRPGLLVEYRQSRDLSNGPVSALKSEMLSGNISAEPHYRLRDTPDVHRHPRDKALKQELHSTR